MLSMYFVPYLIIVTGLTASHLWLFYGLCLLMGAGIVGIGTSVMHDSNHGAYAHNKTVNTLLGGVLNLLGGYARNWRIQHNILHHTYTNIEGLDQDIEAGVLLRMSPGKPAKDYIMLVRYKKSGLLAKEKISFARGILELTLLKVVYVLYMIVLPVLFSGIALQHIILGIVLMQFVAGFSLACIFQPAHVIETSDFAEPDDHRKMENNWAVHQILNTADFAPNNKLVCWYIGGLNFQIEHHLFPHICHIHYPHIAKIVAAVAAEHGIPYQVMPTFRSALYAHGKMLKILGRTEHPQLG